MRYGGEMRRTTIALLRGVCLLAGLTAVAFRLHLNSAATACLYLIAVVVNCLDCGPWPAAAISLLAVGCLDFFFIEPLFKFTVADPLDIAALAAFLTSSLLVSRLAARARQEANRARSERDRLEDLYELAQRLLALDPLSLDAPTLLDTVAKVFRLEAAVFFDASTAVIHTLGNASEEFIARTRDTYIAGRDSDEPGHSVAFRQLLLAGKSMGALGLSGLEEPHRIAGPIVSLVVAGLERARSVRAASRAVAEAQSEILRAAVLDALAHESKTPLATILTAAGGLREAGPLPPQQAELAEIVEVEAARLSDLSTRLLRLARLDCEEVKPRVGPADLVAVVQVAVERHVRLAPGRRILFECVEAPREAVMDETLYALALTQLLDNACRYSPPDSSVTVKVGACSGFATVSVCNSGEPIPSADREHIFERFYRGTNARRRTPGTGLGLYVARKIALAHGGSLDLAPADPRDPYITFRLAVPLAVEEAQHAARTA
jgi:two-component system, OmpR family, sensor histidine kinase KdpD